MVQWTVDSVLRTVKPPIYAVVAVPIAVGSCAARAAGYPLDLRLCAALLLASIWLLTWCNISNDVFDALTGVDEDKEESYVPFLGGWWPSFTLSNIFLLLAVLTFKWALQSLQDVRIVYRLCLSSLLGYVYQGPPFRLSYKGVGEILCFFAFGPVGTPVFYFAQAPGAEITPTVQICAVLVGLSTSLILLCSHFHQGERDLAAGKLSPIVRLGTRRASYVVAAAVAVQYILVVAAGVTARLPWTVLPAAVLSSRVGFTLARQALLYHDNPAVIRSLKFLASRWHLVFHVALAAGLALGPTAAA